MKTFDQCKDEIVKKYGYKHWKLLRSTIKDEASELYAQEVAKDAWERGQVSIIELMKSGFIQFEKDAPDGIKIFYQAMAKRLHAFPKTPYQPKQITK